MKIPLYFKVDLGVDNPTRINAIRVDLDDVGVENARKTAMVLEDIAFYAKRVMSSLGQYGGDIVAHLLDDDDNDGEHLRQLMGELELLRSEGDKIW